MNGTAIYPVCLRKRKLSGALYLNNIIANTAWYPWKRKSYSDYFILREEGTIEYSTNPELIDEKGHLVDCVIDGGEGELSVSTIVDCTTDEFIIKRQGTDSSNKGD